jgi:S-layer homology domain
MSNFSTKIASTVSVVALVATAMSASLVSAASEFLPYAELLADNSVIGTQTNESGYRLGDTITRAEIAKITANLGGFTATACAGTTYGDVSSKLGDLCGAIEALAEAGVVSTANANFRPSASVTRAEATKMLLGAVGEAASTTSAGYMDTASLGDLAGYINRANELGCASTATYFRPNATSSRGEAFKLAACVGGFEATTPTVPPTTTTGTTSTGTTATGVVAGNVTVALDGTAVAQYVPKNASSVKVGTVKLTAGTSDVTVNTVTVTRSGLGDSAGLTVAIAQNGSTISESRAVNTASQDALVRFNNPVTIKAGTTASFDVLASFDSTSKENNQHQFTVKAVGTSATVTGTPVTLGLLNTTSYGVSEVKTVTFTATQPVTSGKNDQKILEVKLQAGAKDTTFNGFTITSAGLDLTKNITNVSAYKNGVKVGAVMLQSDKIYVTGLATKVARQDTVTFELRADVIYVGKGTAAVATDKTTLSIAESTDVSAIEDITGYATSVARPSGTFSSDLTFSTLDIVWTKNTAKSVTVSPGTSNVVLFDAKLASSASFDVTSFKLEETNSPSTMTDANVYANFSSLTLTVNGVDYDLLPTYNQSAGTYTSNNKGALGVYTFASSSDKFRLDAGTPVNVKLTANLTNNNVAQALRSYKFNATIVDVKNLSNSTQILGINKTSGNGDQVSVSAPTIAVKASTVAAPSSNKIYSNASALEVGRFGLEATAEDITVQKITLTTTGATQVNDFTKLVSGQNVKLVNVADGTSVSASVTVNTTSIELTGMSIKVLKDTTSNFKVVVDTQGDLTTVFPTNNKLTLRVTINTATSSSTSSVTGTLVYDTTKIYTASVVPPTVTLTKKSANVFLVKITNVDADVAITLSGVTAQVRPVSVANANYTATTCIRDEGSSDKCDLATSGTGAVPGAAKTFVFTSPISVSKNSSISREIYVDSNFVSPTDLQGEITKINYAGSGSSYVDETYSVIAQ